MLVKGKKSVVSEPLEKKGVVPRTALVGLRSKGFEAYICANIFTRWYPCYFCYVTVFRAEHGEPSAF